jgi:Flp pilus assembly pilin Flp
VTRLLWRLVAEEDGQDLIEYGLLAGLYAALSAALFPVIADLMSTAYQSWVSGAHAAWEPCPPGSSPCP